MKPDILELLHSIIGANFEDSYYLSEALCCENNQKLAEIGDSVLNLTLRKFEYSHPNSTPQTMDDLRQKLGKKKKMKEILNSDKQFVEYLRDERGYIIHDFVGLNRSDTIMEAMIGAIFLELGFVNAEKFTHQILDLR